MSLTRRSFISAAAALAAAGTARADDSGPIYIGVSEPLTGPVAQYGAQFRASFDLALEAINAPGLRPLELVWEDSQADPRQSVAIAQKFVNDPRIIVEIGDFSSTASMAASPIYQRAKLVQFGMTNSHPNFTKGGDYMWSTSITQAEEQPNLADYVVNGLGLKKLAVLHLNTDWGAASKTFFVQGAEARGGQVVATEAFLPGEKDFRSTLVRVRDANPDGLVLEAYYADGAAIARQARDLGLKVPIAAVGSVYSPKFIELGGDAVEGVYTQANFFPDDPRPDVQAFVQKFVAKYGRQPDEFNATAYDTLNLLAAVIRQFGASREAVHEGLAKIKDVPSVVYGRITLDPETRRVAGAKYERLIVKGGRFTLWDGSRPAAG